MRDRFCAGVRFATVAHPSEGCAVAVVWTRDNEAHVYDVLGHDSFRFSRILEGEEDPFETWMRHLGGSEIVEQERRCSQSDASLRPRSAERLFRDHIVPYFGRHPLARDPSSMRNVRNDHWMWDVIRRVSESMTIPARYVWRRVL